MKRVREWVREWNIFLQNIFVSKSLDSKESSPNAFIGELEMYYVDVFCCYDRVWPEMLPNAQVPVTTN